MTTFDPYPLFLLGVGILTIFFLILYLRVHAFLALITAALLVGLLSPNVVLERPDSKDSDQTVRFAPLNAPREVGLAFGSLLGSIGLVIAFATIVGKALMDSGGADRIVRAFLRLFGERLAPLALLTSGFVLGIPVFFDTVFFLLVPLAKALHLRTGKNYLLYVTAIGAGAAITHSLVPPTPGPIAMAASLKVDLGWTIVMGILVGAPLSVIGFAYAALANKLWPVPLRQVGEESLADLEKSAHRPDHELPSLFASLLPIILPVMFITSATLFKTLADNQPELNDGWMIGHARVAPRAILDFIGHPSFALFLAALVSLWLVSRQNKMSLDALGRFTGKALDEAGLILLITAAGGSFGRLLLLAGVGDSLSALANQFSISPLVLAWAMGALFKIAQGSGTVSMITTAQIMAGIVFTGAESHGLSVPAYLGYDPVYLVMAIGAGSKIGSWMNDSGFWVVGKMSGMTEGETFKSWTMCLVLMGLAGLPLIWLLSTFMPLV